MGREMGGSFKRERTYVYLFMLRFDRIQNSVKQLSFNKKLIKKKKKECPGAGTGNPWRARMVFVTPSKLVP